MTGKLATTKQSFHYFVQDSALPHSVDTAKYVHLGIQIPNDMFFSAPQRFYLYLSNVICIFLHGLYLIKYCTSANIKQNHDIMFTIQLIFYKNSGNTGQNNDSLSLLSLIHI
eukprot:TRINITY_DN27078_c0_g1_i1.p3 TRINITY_DN27078_c0_g1~~TRINITY_DN27078_c0_g1_i1.p3  ORF type:complete len:112 (-),score=0.52 TRINITY_DN27078_c0_g1_i1:126-461(-)